jgi:glycosyltransferase involved in cell wall biosynthesis
MLTDGINNRQNRDVVSHTICFTNDIEKLFPRITVSSENVLTAFIPLPKDEKLLFKNSFWKKRYISIVCEILTPYLKNFSSLCFQYNNLFLSELAEVMKNKFGGKIIACLHCLPWKFKLNSNIQIFSRLYRLYHDGQYDIFRRLENSTVNYALSDMIICLSSSAKEYIVNIHNIDPEKIKIIYNGLPDDANGKMRSEKSRPEILYVGKVSRDKGIFEMLGVLKNIRAKGLDFGVTVAGSVSGIMTDKIKNDCNMQDIDFRGEIPFNELKKLYFSCTFGVIPSLHEQCSYVAIEMAMSGLPVIVSDVDALAEIFEHEKTALLTPLVLDPELGIKIKHEQFEKNIIRLLTDKTLREKLSRNIRKLYENKFTHDKMISETVAVYKQLYN